MHLIHRDAHVVQQNVPEENERTELEANRGVDQARDDHAEQRLNRKAEIEEDEADEHHITKVVELNRTSDESNVGCEWR